MNLERPISAHDTAPAAYEAPAIESVATTEELDREVAYAAFSEVSTPPNTRP